MVNAFVLVNIDGKNVREIANNLLNVEGVTEVYAVAGEYDFVVVVRVSDNPTLSRIVTEDIIHLTGIRHTKTLFALDQYATVDLSKVFGLE